MISESKDCTVIRLENESGTGDMIIYRVFDGIYLMYNDFSMSYYQSLFQTHQTMLAVDYCREGSLVLEGLKEECIKNPGNICIDSRVHHKGKNLFPEGHYEGITIGFINKVAKESLEKNVPGIPVDFHRIREKFCKEEGYYLIERDETLHRLFMDLYRVPDSVRIPYFRTKILELLVCLSYIEPEDSKGNYFYKEKVEKTRAVRQFLVNHIDTNYTIAYLSQEFEIAQTSLKECFKSLYGQPISTWLRDYRMEIAKQALRKNKEMSISDIALSIGYKSQSRFGVVFKNLYGMTPYSYRHEHKEKEKRYE